MVTDLDDFVEFNHDKEMLNTGLYPNSLKSRVGGDFGHLNNWQNFGTNFK